MLKKYNKERKTLNSQRSTLNFIVPLQPLNAKAFFEKADMAQLVEQRIRNAWVAGSSPAIGSFLTVKELGIMEFFPDSFLSYARATITR